MAGRAVGNLRQPNHLSSLLLWAAIAVVPLLELRRLRLGAALALFALMIFAVVLTASRTGVLGVGLLTLGGLLDLRLSRPARTLLLSSPLLYALAWAGLAAWAEFGHHAFGGEARLAEADLSGSRFGIWANTLELIRAQPWTGVGFGEFNLAWTLTPFPGRPTAFFDHTHNLPLQLAVECGVPLALAVTALLLAALWRIWRLSQVEDAAAALCVRSALLMLVLIVLHSQLEYPLWYAYFLLPTAPGHFSARGARGPAVKQACTRAYTSSTVIACMQTLLVQVENRWL
jgi:O-antigen ligase